MSKLNQHEKEFFRLWVMKFGSDWNQCAFGSYFPSHELEGMYMGSGDIRSASRGFIPDGYMEETATVRARHTRPTQKAIDEAFDTE
jgi:hypothetical protein